METKHNSVHRVQMKNNDTGFRFRTLGIYSNSLYDIGQVTSPHEPQSLHLQNEITLDGLFLALTTYDAFILETHLSDII